MKKTAVTPPILVDPLPSLIPDRPYLGEDVLYVLADGVTIRPAKIVAFVVKLSPRYDIFANLHVFFDGSNDNEVRGPHAGGSITEWVTSVRYQGPVEDPEAGTILVPRTWHRQSQTGE